MLHVPISSTRHSDAYFARILSGDSGASTQTRWDRIAKSSKAATTTPNATSWLLTKLKQMTGEELAIHWIRAHPETRDPS